MKKYTLCFAMQLVILAATAQGYDYKQAYLDALSNSKWISISHPASLTGKWGQNGSVKFEINNATFTHETTKGAGEYQMAAFFSKENYTMIIAKRTETYAGEQNVVYYAIIIRDLTETRGHFAQSRGASIRAGITGENEFYSGAERLLSDEGYKNDYFYFTYDKMP